MNFEFIKVNGIDLLSYLITFISVIITIFASFKTHKKNKIYKILTIVNIIPDLVKKAEDIYKLCPKSGILKLTYVLQEIKLLCNEENVNYNENYYKSEIEKILNTPEKKKED